MIGAVCLGKRRHVQMAQPRYGWLSPRSADHRLRAQPGANLRF